MAAACIAVAAGATCAPLNPNCRAAEFEGHFTRLRCRSLLVPAGSASPSVAVARARNIPIIEVISAAGGVAGHLTLKRDTPHGQPGHSPNPGVAEREDVALALHTSGTTARPRLVPLTHGNLCTAARNICAALELVPGDRCLSVMPLNHIHGLSALFASLAAGASVICPGSFEVQQFFELMDAFHPTWFTAAPTIHSEILEKSTHHPGTIARSSLRLIRSASAAMPRHLIEEMERVFQVPFIEAYGMTEAAPQIASNRLSPKERKPESVGTAAGPDIAIMDDTGQIVPPGSVGEIVIRGANVISAYEDDPEANASAFVQGWFRTGDAGYLDADGFLFITGRIKEVVNRGGEKISPREVEEVLLGHPAVAQAVAFPIPHATLGEDIAAAIVPGPEGRVVPKDSLIREIRRFASVRLSDLKVPQLMLIVDEVPKGPAGKVQRLGLAEKLGLTSPSWRLTGFTASRTTLEAGVAKIWADVLGTARPGIDDNFFQSGGDSLKAAQVLSRLSGEFPVELPPQSLFQHPTVAELAELVSLQLSNGGDTVPAIPSRNASEPCPLSFAQQRLWFLDQLEPGNPAYNMPVALRLSGRLCQGALEESLGEILRRHEALRTTFRTIDGHPVQVVSPAQPVGLPVVELTGLSESDRQAEALRLASDEAVRPFDLESGPLFRATLLKLDSQEHMLLITVHHIVSDGWSTRVLLRELEMLYAALASGQPSPMEALPIQYGDFAAWQRQWLQGETLTSQLAYWKRQLEGMPPLLELPADRPRPAVRRHQGASYSMEIPHRLTEGLKALAQREDATPFMTLLAAFQTLLHRYTGEADLVVGTPIANRTRPETLGLIGMFANTLVMRADLSGNPSFREMLGRVRINALDAYARQDLPFEKLVEELHPERDHRHNPLFQVMFAYQNLPENPSADTGGDLAMSPVEVTRGAAKFDLTLYVFESGQGLSTTWQYDTDLFEAPRIARMAGHFQTLLEGIVAAPESTLSDLPLLTDAERNLFLSEWNQTATTYRRDRCFHHLFEEQARLTPDAPAVRSGEEGLTYGELNTRANRLAWRLQQMGVGPETPVGILLPRSTSVVTAVLAVMKAGGAFVPLDPTHPAEHVAFILDDANVMVLVTESDLRPLADIPKVVCLDSESEVGAADGGENPVSGAIPSNLAYLIYTSGSTGTPRGVTITHANLSHYVHSMGAVLDIGAHDRYLHTASFAFSSSVRQFAVPLSWGASVEVAPSETIRDPQALFEVVGQREVSIIDLVPSHWRACLQALSSLPPAIRADLLTNNLRLALSASEPLHPDLTRELGLALGPDVRLINMYGQTETTGIVTIYPVPLPDGDSTKVVPIGRPIANTRAYVLDSSRQPVPLGVWGELYIGGAGVGRGYLNDPELTADRFVPDPFSQSAEARLYRTGDLARYRSNGDLEFSGRVDRQMKVRGYRVEPGQVEAVVSQHPAWRESAVAPQEDAWGEKHLVAFVVANPGVPHSAQELREFVKQKLPEYMIPSRIVELTALPRTPNGKVDWMALDAGLAGGNGAHADHRVEPMLATQAEEILTGIWAQVLSRNQVSLDDNFFDLGGNSILSIQMISRANQAGLQLTPKQLWQNQTIAELASAAVGLDEPVKATEGTEEVQTKVRVTIESLRSYGLEALGRAGLAPEGAAIVTEVQLEASLRDQATHNMVSIPRYAERIAAGTLNPQPDIRIENEKGISAQVDGDNAPGQWVAVVAMEKAIRIAQERGVGIVAVRRSNHLGAAGHYPWLAAREGLIGLCTTTGPVILAPTGGTTPTFGNNPLGVAIPAESHHPIMLDIAMSVAPRGRIGLQLAEGKPLPPGWILDGDGRSSTDLTDLVAGLGVPIGGHKGYGLTFVMEVLAGVLTGAGFGWDNRREHGPRMMKPANFGHFFMAIDPEIFLPSQEFTARVDRLIEQAKSGERATGVEEILVPGELELRAREQSLREGAPLRHSTYHALRKYARKAGLDTELEIVTGSASEARMALKT
jgi:amino acid adenylation domain-containing protein